MTEDRIAQFHQISELMYTVIHCANRVRRAAEDCDNSNLEFNESKLGDLIEDAEKALSIITEMSEVEQ